MLNGLNGIPVRFSEHALEDTKERLFPESRYRSKRLHKKLVKRFGGEFVRVPCIFRVNDPLYGPYILAHPSYRQRFLEIGGSNG